ncbi:MAG TPA: hypothetical protein PKD73_06755, partial [Burkholderiaceae bacterium]|nr:hypothetical protein [Burkholderiaceae bacterium]
FGRHHPALLVNFRSASTFHGFSRGASGLSVPGRCILQQTQNVLFGGLPLSQYLVWIRVECHEADRDAATAAYRRRCCLGVRTFVKVPKVRKQGENYKNHSFSWSNIKG